MKKTICIIALIIGCVSMKAQLGYRYQSEFITLVPNNEKELFVQTRTAKSRMALEKSSSVMAKSAISPSIKMISDNRFIVSRNVRQDNANDYVSDIYTASNGAEVIVLPKIILYLPEGATIDNILTNKSEKLTLESGSERLYKFSCSAGTSKEVLDITGKIYKQ